MNLYKLWKILWGDPSFKNETKSLQTFNFIKKGFQNIEKNKFEEQNLSQITCRVRGKIVGSVLYTINGEFCHINYLFVLQNFRKRGIGRKLKSLVIETAKKEGCKRITSHVRESNIPSINLNKSLGFKRVIITSEGKTIVKRYSNGEIKIKFSLWI